MSRSHEASRGARLESTELGSGGGAEVGPWAEEHRLGRRGGGHRAFGQVGVGSGVNW